MTRSACFRYVVGFCALFAMLSGEAKCDASEQPPATSGLAKEQTTTFFKLFCKIHIDEKGQPQSIEVLRAEPNVDMTRQEMQELANTMLTWTFRPIERDGKAVAGIVTAPMLVDLAGPINVRTPSGADLLHP